MKIEWKESNIVNPQRHDYIVDGNFNAFILRKANKWYAHVFYLSNSVDTYHDTLDEAKAVVVALVAMR